MIGEKCRHEIWNEWLDGYAATTIARYALDGETNTPVSPAMVKWVIADGPPDTLRDDPRFVYGIRAFWIAARGRANELTATEDSFTVVFSPRRYTGKTFLKAVRAIARDYVELSAGGKLDKGVLEGMEVDIAFKFVHDKEYLAWTFNEDGEIERYDGKFKPRGVEATETRGPGL